jgi:acyl-CoA reductase-like NAD-dependent aldehyde dehydrogenase
MTVVRAFHLPPGTEDLGTALASEPLGPVGSPLLAAHTPIVWPTFGRESASALLDALRDAKSNLDRLPAEEVAEKVGEIGERFGDPADPLRSEAESRVALESGLAPASAGLVVDYVAREWSRARLGSLLRADFPDPSVLDAFTRSASGDWTRALGGSLALHVGSGNVPGVGATSIIRSLLVKCPVLLKPGREDVALACLFARALAESHPGLGKAVAVVYWPRGRGGDLEALALERAERVVVYGGNAFVREVRARTPVGTGFIAYPHRLSVGLVGRELLDDEARARGVATRAAEAASAYDGRGCVSPKVIWVEGGESVEPRAWASLLAAQMDRIEDGAPAAPLDFAAAATLQQLRGSSEIAAAAGGEHAVFSGSSSRWAVLFEPSPDRAIEITCPGRSVVVRPIDRLERVPDLLVRIAEALQSVALAVGAGRRAELARRLVQVGATRVTSFERLAWPPAWWRHDGTAPLLSLVRWATLEP